ncbi:MAG: ComF family protein [Verrucomicrobiota bacterium]|nr:ComF family protein [Verrucomicrobiota bacterium]MDP7050392.1 ComF family protein [Verrucomicrobiota bacterium]
MNRWKTALAGFVKGSLNLIFPEVCQLCRGESAKPEDGFVCTGCFAKLKSIQPPFCKRCGQPFAGEFSGGFECANCVEMGLKFEFARAAMQASVEMLDVIHRFKYEQALWLEPLFDRLLRESAVEQIRAWRGDCLVPVPLHSVRFRERGFNQAEQLCRNLARATGLGVETRAVKRTRMTQTQTRLTRSERLANMRGAFKPHKRNLNGRRVVLVDDVLTTGVTTSECAKSCKQAGAAAVGVWTLARGIALGCN